MAQQTGLGKYPIDNLTYDLTAVIHEKCKAIEAYDEYLKDAQNDREIHQLLQQCRQQDEQLVRQLQQHLHRCLMESGKRAA